MAAEPGPPGIDADLDMILAEIVALRELASDPEEAEDGAKVYDFGIRWGVLLSGRLKRLEHYHRTGELAEEQERRYRELGRELRDATPLAERLGVARPPVPPETPPPKQRSVSEPEKE